MPSYRFYSGELRHSSGPWKKHKYLQKIGNKYIYPIKKAFQVRRNLQDAKQKLNNERISEALATNYNHQRMTAAQQRRDELQRQYNRTWLGRAENGFRGVARRISALGPKQDHKISISSGAGYDHVVDLNDIEKKLKKKKKNRGRK